MSGTEWQPLAGDTRGPVTALARGVGNLVFATTPVGVYRSADAGCTWDFSGVDTGVAFGEAVAVAGENVFVGAPDGLHRSPDGGRSWRQVLAGSRVAAICAEANVVLAGTDMDGLLRSDDGGGHWSGVNAGLLDLEVLAVCLSPGFASDRLAFVGTGSGVYRSRNGGDSWRAADTGLDESAVQCIAIGPDRLVVAGTEADGLVCSDDGGTTWRRPTALTDRSVSALAISSAGSIFAATDLGLFHSADHGQSWAVHTNEPGQILALTYLENGALLAGTARTGVWRGQGETWTTSSTGMHASLLSMLVARDDALWAAGPTEGVRVWDADVWTDRSRGLPDAAVLGLTLAADGHAFAATPNGVYLWSESTWRLALPGSTRAVCASKRVVAVAERVAASDDLGETWRTLSTPFQAEDVIAVAASDAALVLATREGSETVVWRSADGGDHWARVFVDPTPRETLPIAVSADGVFVGVNGRVVRSDGTSSAPVDGAITAIAAAPNGNVWLGATSGVFVSRDGGQTFMAANGPKRTIAIAPTRGLVYALELGGRVWRRSC